jgi:hypothetical protein
MAVSLGSLGWHIVIASFGEGMPAVTVYTEWRGLRTGDETCISLARTCARASRSSKPSPRSTASGRQARDDLAVADGTVKATWPYLDEQISPLSG